MSKRRVFLKRNVSSLGILLALAAQPGCGSSDSLQMLGDDHGQMSVRLRAQTLGIEYRLTGAIFDVTGPESLTLVADDNPEALVIQHTLDAGDYSVELRDGWALERMSPVDLQFDAVQATLVSPDPLAFTIVDQQTTSVVYAFETDGTLVTLAEGDLDLSLQITNTGAPPTLSVTSPLPDELLTTADDCGATLGLQVLVQGTTSAEDGSTATVALGSSSALTVAIADGAFSACVEATDGAGQTLTVTVRDQITGLEATDERLVDVDDGPSVALAAPTPLVLSRREGLVQLSWVAGSDADAGALAAYELRCGASDIVDEATWSSASALPVTVIPSIEGSIETQAFDGFLAGSERFCAVRGRDAQGALTPIQAGSSASVENPFLAQRYAVLDDANVAGTVANVVIEPLGDINGDGVQDFAYGAVNQGVQLFFGDVSLAQDLDDVEAADVAITNAGAVGGTLGFGAEVAGLGDITGDGLPDFAVSARGANTVFVFFGRAAASPWPATISLNSVTPCAADLCLVGAGLGGATGGLFGWDMHSSNFDGAGPLDLVISARTANTVGQVFVLLGGAQLAQAGTTLTLPADAPDGFIINPPAERTNFGFSVGSVPGATLDDLVIGANGVTSGATTAAAFVVAGRSLPPVGGLVSITPTEIDTGVIANFGNPVRAIGDYDGDGSSDFALGLDFNQGGAVNLYRGAPGGFSNADGSVFRFDNDTSPFVDDNYGTFIACGDRSDLGLIGDLDGDGTGELLIGATAPDTGAPVGSTGTAQLYYGATSAGARSRTAADFTYSALSGQVIPNFVGDIDGDGFNDLALLDSGAGTNQVILMY